MEIILGKHFRRNPGFKNGAGNNALQVNRNLILTINPQNPITGTKGDGVQHANWSIIDNGRNKFTVVPNAGAGLNGLENARAEKIGIKVIHLRPDPNDPRTTLDRAPYFNGGQGQPATVEVKIFNAEGKLVENGSAMTSFVKRGAEIFLTNAGLVTSSQGNPTTVTAELTETTHFQRVKPRALLRNTIKTVPFSSGTPYGLRFLLFDRNKNQPNAFIPQKGIAGVGYVIKRDKKTAILVKDTNQNGIADRRDAKIGTIRLIGPAADAELLPNPTLTVSGDGITGPNGSALDVLAKAGSQRGIYEVTVALKQGPPATSFFTVVPTTRCNYDLTPAPGQPGKANVSVDGLDLQIRFRGANPLTLYSIWIDHRNRATGELAADYPLDKGAANRGVAPGFATTTGVTSGMGLDINGLVTDAQGNGTIKLELDYDLLATSGSPVVGAQLAMQGLNRVGGGWLRIYPVDPATTASRQVTDPKTGLPRLELSTAQGITVVRHLDKLTHGHTPGVGGGVDHTPGFFGDFPAKCRGLPENAALHRNADHAAPRRYGRALPYETQYRQTGTRKEHSLFGRPAPG